METLDAEIDGFRSGNFNPHILILNNNKKNQEKKNSWKMNSVESTWAWAHPTS